MSSIAFRMKPEEVNTPEKRKGYTVCIIGCGQRGIHHAFLFAEAGFRTICADADPVAVGLLGKGKPPFMKRELEFRLRDHLKSGRLTVTGDIKTAVSQSDVIVLTLPVGADRKGKADYSEMEGIGKRAGSSLQRGSLVIVASIVGQGITEGLIRETLENASGLKVGADFGLAYSPASSLNETTGDSLTAQRRIIGSSAKNALDAACAVLETIAGSGLTRTRNVKAAELATLFELLQQDVDAALADEFAFFCEKAGIDYTEARSLVAASSGAKLPLPALGNGGTLRAANLLLEDAENLNAKLRMSSLAREINEAAVKHAVDLTKDAIRSCGKTLRRARISLLGVSQRQNMKSPPKRAAARLARQLEARGARVSLYDPYFSDGEAQRLGTGFKKSLSEATENADCVVILTAHDQFRRLSLKRLKVVMRMPASIVDFEGVIRPDEAEEEGFIYRGLGRGVWRK